jgi:hypothetical protein
VKVLTILLREMPITIVLEIWKIMINHVLGDVVTTPTINFALPIIIAYVKDERANLNFIIVALKSITSCEIMWVWRKLFKAFVLGMHFSMFVIVDEKVYKGLKCVSIKFRHVNMQKCISQIFFWKGNVRMDRGFYKFWNTPKEIEYFVKTKHYRIIQNDQTFA